MVLENSIRLADKLEVHLESLVGYTFMYGRFLNVSEILSLFKSKTLSDISFSDSVASLGSQVLE